jgi:hypothetical protein
MAEIATYSEVAVANLALQGVGRGDFLVTLTEDTQAARLVRHQLPYSRDAVLRAYPWNFAQARGALPADDATPAFEYTYQYSLPSDCLWMHTLVDADADEKWCIEAGKILTNIGAPLNVKYTKRVTDLAASDPLFIQTLAAHIAASIAVPLTESSTKAESLWKVYQMKLREARAVDAQEGACESLPTGSWHDARFSGISDTY